VLHTNYKVFIFLLGRLAPAQRSSEFPLVFVTVIVTAIVCLVPVIDC